MDILTLILEDDVMYSHDVMHWLTTAIQLFEDINDLVSLTSSVLNESRLEYYILFVMYADL